MIADDSLARVGAAAGGDGGCPLGQVLGSYLAEADRDLLAQPHIAVCADSRTGLTTYVGPFSTAFDALAAVETNEMLCAAWIDDACDQRIRCTLAPIFSA